MPIYVCGRGDDGQLGVQQSRDSPLTVLAALQHTRVAAVAVGSGHTLLLDEDGRVWSCGRGDDGRLGHGDITWRFEPKLVDFFPARGLTVSSIGSGSYHSAALTREGRLFTWGGALYGKLGHGNEEPCPTPRLVAGLANKVVLQVACGR